jgi:branched-chain amino acid transport system ATP-binding protein
MSMIEVKDVRVLYGRAPALQGVSITVQEGEVVGIVGTNGAGKSTLLLSILGVVNPVQGEILFEGTTLLRVAPEDIVRKGVALVPERRHIFHGMTVQENLKLGGLFRKDKAGEAASMEYVLDLFPKLQQFLPNRAGCLSGGEQQMLALGRALMANPRLLLLDEPSLGLGPLICDRVFEDLLRLRDAGLTILLVEQSVDRLLAAADRAYVLRSGRVALEGVAGSLSRADVRAAYFGEQGAETGS